MRTHADVLRWEFFVLNLASYIAKFQHLCIYCTVLSMEDGQYFTTSGYLKHVIHPAAFMKLYKFVLRRSYKNYKLVKGKLYYKEQI